MGEVKVELIDGGGEGYTFFRTDETGADAIYADQLNFWRYRSDHDEESIQQRLEEYRVSNRSPEAALVNRTVSWLFNRRPADAPFSMIELGCANGPIVHFLADKIGLEAVRYLGLEPFDRFVDDLNESFSMYADIRGIVADAESFSAMDVAAFPDAPYGVFYASLVFCMMSPRIAEPAIVRACQIAERILLVDMTANASGEKDPQEPVVFDYSPGTQQYYFAHRFNDTVL